MKKLILSCLAVACVAFTSVAQDSPYRVGLKFGVPNIAGLNLEYASPLVGGRLAATADFTRFTLDFNGPELTFMYIEFGGNFYLIKPGKGLYGHVSYGSLNIDATASDPTYGEGSGSLSLGLLNFKLGTKWGEKFYFRSEIGYGLALSDAEYTLQYPSYRETEDVPSALAGGVLFNLGIGVGF